MTRYMPVRVYDYYAPGEYFYPTPLFNPIDLLALSHLTCLSNDSLLSLSLSLSLCFLPPPPCFIERFNETMVNAYSLYVLSICHVCGSYQCPYCPIFSSSPLASIINTPVLVILIICSIFNYTRHLPFTLLS